MKISFETWKAEYQPRVYEDSGAECYDHDECECEFLYTVDLNDMHDDDATAGRDRRLWTWRSDGTIVTGIEDVRGDILITEKPYKHYMLVS